MQSPSSNISANPTGTPSARAPFQAQRVPGITRSMSGIRRLRSDESWIEVSSQPSSSSLSSAANDDNIPPGYRVHHDIKRRRRLNRAVSLPYGAPVRSASTAGSSQEEYEESESESDRIMTSSNEGLEQQSSEGVSPAAQTSSASEQGEEDDDDENSTALGVVSHEQAFTPQPNAFSHPPQAQTARPTEVRDSYFPTPREPPRLTARSYPSQRSRSHTPYNIISPSHQADHDAALRASLSTLLSCAAAARGLPKREQAPALPRRPTPPSTRVEPMTLRMVPESVAVGQVPEAPRSTARKRSPSNSTGQSGNEKGKRKASTSKDRREARKKQRPSIDELNVSPTLMTWVVSAGVVVLFSAISFSAGYVIGREVGRLEAGSNGAGQGFVSSKEMGKGLRKLRWAKWSGITLGISEAREPHFHSLSSFTPQTLQLPQNMICQRCLSRRQPMSSLRFFSTTTRLPSPANPPAATSTSAAQPFSTPFTPSPARNPEYKDAVSQSVPSDATVRPTKQATAEPKSSVKAGTVLRGLGYIKGKEAPIAKEDHEYPDWLWGLLDGRKDAGKEGKEEGDLFAKSKKQRRIAAKAERKALKANPSLAFAAPKIPLEHQSIDLPAATPNAQDTSETEAQRTAREAREELTGAMRKSRRKSIKEGNFLKAMR